MVTAYSVTFTRLTGSRHLRVDQSHHLSFPQSRWDPKHPASGHGPVFQEMGIAPMFTGWHFKKSTSDRLEITKLHASISDLRKAVTWARHILTKKWCRGRCSSGQTYSRQSTYVPSIVMAYGRVFASGRNGRKFPERLIEYDNDDRALHQRLLEMRNAVYAHSSLDRFTAKPWKVDDFETTVIGEPINKIEEPDLQRLVAMAERLQAAASERYSAIIAPYPEASRATDPDASALDPAMEAIVQLDVGANHSSQCEG